MEYSVRDSRLLDGADLSSPEAGCVALARSKQPLTTSAMFKFIALTALFASAVAVPSTGRKSELVSGAPNGMWAWVWVAMTAEHDGMRCSACVWNRC
eukprot:COSAG02_NODE_23_length_52893_cov_58.101868_24_plen_97_part_00